MEPKSNYQRPASTEIAILQILEGEYVQEEGIAQNYLLTKNNNKVYFVNLIGSILRKEIMGNITNLWIDDGTAQIVLRFFEEHKKAKVLEVGDIVLVIGRPRVYNQEKYISPEVIVKSNSAWLKVRMVTLSLNEQKNKIVPSSSLPSKEEIIIEEIKENELLPVEKIIRLIKELDQGTGVLIETVLVESSLEGTEQILKRMMENGEIFQNAPGKVKVL